MSQRFFFESDPEHPLEPGMTVELDHKESHHLIHVMRAEVGDGVELFDDSGFQFPSEIVALDRKLAQVRLRSKDLVDRELNVQLVVALPFPKADRQKFLVEKLTEIGVSTLIFVTTNRASVRGNEKSIAKLKRIVVEASKQCGRNRLMNLLGPIDLNELVNNSAGIYPVDSHKYFGHPAEGQTSSSTNQAAGDQVLMIGPEGGLDEDEVELLKDASWQPLQFGRTILRMETAALVGATILSRR